MFETKCAIITGASRGIGKATAIMLASYGCDVAIVYNSSSESAEAVKKECINFGVKAECYKCNVADFDECKSTVEKISQDFENIHILINNAGITRDNLMLRMDEKDFDDVIGTNLKGTFNMIKACYRIFTKNRSGKIINISSVAGIMGNAGQTNYASSKAGIIGLTKSVAKELSSRGICCNAIAPGFIETDMTVDFSENETIIGSIPLKRIGKPEEVASLAVFLASDSANYITGETIRIDGGLAM